MNQAALDDAQKQFNDTHKDLLYACDKLNQAEDAIKYEVLQGEVMRKELTEAKEEIERLRGNLLVAERNNGLEVTHLREQVQRQDQRIWQANFDVQFADATRRQAERDRDHYKAQMDLQGEKLIEQQTQLKRWGRFDVVSSRQDGGHT